MNRIIICLVTILMNGLMLPACSPESESEAVNDGQDSTDTTDKDDNDDGKEPEEKSYDVLPLEAPVVDNSTFFGKALFGYQGWFGHPDDQSPRPNAWHWGSIFEPLKPNFEMYPDLREYCSDEKYRTDYTYPDGTMACLYSANNRRTVMRHMKWLRDYHLDGVLVQRFANEFNDMSVVEFRDRTTEYVMDGCEKYGRVFAIMYDGASNNVDDIINDWKAIVDTKRFTSSSRYLHHDGLPLVAVFGYTFYDGTAESLARLMDFFTAAPEEKYRASVLLSLNDNWFTLDESWLASFRKAKLILPWAVGRYHDISSFQNNYVKNQMYPAMSWCEDNGVTYVPLVFPGFSWNNLKDNGKENEIPRDGGNFMWAQAYFSLMKGCKSLYFAMFDEVDEATCYFKTAENASMSPDRFYWLNLDADGYELPSDWYLRCAAKATIALHGTGELTKLLGEPPMGGVTLYPVDGPDGKRGIRFLFPDFEGESTLEFSIDGGKTWPYSVADSEEEYYLRLTAGTYDIYVRHGEGRDSVPMGEVMIK